MIITTHEEWTNLFNSIKAESSSSDEKHVFIYACATDADSVCALRILEVGAACRRRRGWLHPAQLRSCFQVGLLRLFPALFQLRQ